MANFIPNFSTSYGTTSENDDEAILNGAAILLFAPKAEQYDGPLIKVPCRTGDMPGWKWVQELILGHPLRILENCRITVDNFMRLCDILVQNNYVPQNPHKHVSIEESLAMTLVMLSHRTRTRVVAERFQHSTETIHRNVAEVLLGLCRFAQRIIRPRETNDVHPRIRYSTKYYPWFKVNVGIPPQTFIVSKKMAISMQIFTYIAFTLIDGTKSCLWCLYLPNCCFRSS
mgnify:CR=1 FL=1